MRYPDFQFLRCIRVRVADGPREASGFVEAPVLGFCRSQGVLALGGQVVGRGPQVFEGGRKGTEAPVGRETGGSWPKSQVDPNFEMRCIRAPNEKTCSLRGLSSREGRESGPESRLRRPPSRPETESTSERPQTAPPANPLKSTDFGRLEGGPLPARESLRGDGMATRRLRISKKSRVLSVLREVFL